MSPFTMLHEHPAHRSRQLRWVLPLLALLLGAVLLTLAVQYFVSGREVETEFFRAHKTISNTSQLLWRGLWVGSGVLVLAVLGIAAWALRTTHRIVSPVHTLHRALIELAAGDLGVRVELRGNDEFREVADSANRLVAEFSGTLEKVHDLTDRILALSEKVARDPNDEQARALLRQLAGELDGTMEFFRLRPVHTIRDEQA
jgi:methyl-accepting chemotaxis protein